MYIARQELGVQVIVPQRLCTPYQAQDGRNFVEIMIPPEDINDYQENGEMKNWGSIMVMPIQIHALEKGGAYNVVNLNSDSRIICSIKDQHTRRVMSSETLLPEDIVGRFLKYYRFLRFVDEFIQNECVEDLNTNSFNMYLDMHGMGQTMQVYMNRLPRTISQ